MDSVRGVTDLSANGGSVMRCSLTLSRTFTATARNQLWGADITEHPTREGKECCCCVLDVYSRKIVGWAIDTRQTTNLVLNALDMAIEARKPTDTVIQSDHGTQFTSWAFTSRIRDAGRVGSMGTIGDRYDNAMIESFWGNDASGAARQEEVEDPAGARKHGLRIRRGLLQPFPSSFRVTVGQPHSFRSHRAPPENIGLDSH